MEKITFILRAFGFESLRELKVSAFGFTMHKEVWAVSSVVGFFTTLAQHIKPVFGVEWMFFAGYVGLVVFEWATGVWASLHRGERHESRKLGRMLLKILIYCILIALLHQMTKITIPESFDFLEVVNPFKWLYWIVMFIIVWQLWVSVLENLDSLGFRFAKVALRVINRKFEKELKINDNTEKE